MNDTSSPEQRLAAFASAVDGVRKEIGKLIVGQRAIVDGVLTCLLAGGHALLDALHGLA